MKGVIMYIIKVYVNHNLTKTVTSNDKSLIMERYKSLAGAAEQYTLGSGYDTRVELYKNDKLMSYIETEF
jgi:hypothetical protein